MCGDHLLSSNHAAIEGISFSNPPGISKLINPVFLPVQFAKVCIVFSGIHINVPVSASIHLLPAKIETGPSKT